MNSQPEKIHEISLAPMLKVTTPLFRLLIRKTSKSVVLFTEMIVSSTVVNVTPEKLKIILGSPEDATVVQLGGSDPLEVARSVEILVAVGWKHFNLNCGCPSERVKSGKFGAVLMLEKERVAAIVNAVYERTGIVLSLKIRTGVDENDTFEFLKGFVEHVSTHSPCFKFYIHARKCWLCGLNPKQNRTVPALNYECVYRLKRDLPHLFISLNGGIKADGMELVDNLDGLMIGRYACENLKVFNDVYGGGHEREALDMKEIVRTYLVEAAELEPPMFRVIMPLINIRKGQRHSKEFKQTINRIMHSGMPYDEIFAHLEPYLD